MIVIALLILFDVVVLPISGSLSGGVFIFTILAGVLLVKNYKNWFLVSLTLITLASAIYLLGDPVINDTVVHKLSDWSLTTLVIAVIYLAFSTHKKA